MWQYSFDGSNGGGHSGGGGVMARTCGERGSEGPASQMAMMLMALFQEAKSVSVFSGAGWFGVSCRGEGG